MRTRIVGLVALSLAAPAAAADDAFSTAVAPFLKQHCISCHGPRKQESGLRLDLADGVTADNRHLWTLVHERVAAGDMPPADSPQPAAGAAKDVLAAVAARQRALGAGGVRRLNRRELAAALRDVTGSAVDFAAALPGDGTVAGFDTGADGLQEAADAVAQWLLVTRRATDALRFLDAPAGPAFAADLCDAKDARKTLDAWKAAGATWKAQGINRPGEGLLIEPRAAGDREELVIHIPAPAGRDGVLRLTLVVSAMKPLPGLPNPRLGVRVGGRDLDFREITGSLDAPQTLVYEVQLGDVAVQAKGVAVGLANKVELPYAVAGFENEDKANPKEPVPGGTGLFRPVFDRKALPPDKQPAPFVVLQHIAVEPGAVAQWPPAAWKAAVGEVKDDSTSANRLLTLFAERAWRRPAAAGELAPISALYEKLRAGGRGFDAALRAAFQAVLMSPQFRYMPPPAAGQHALASRLSFMLAGAPPATDLRALAAAGKLGDPATLAAEADRLLAGPGRDAFVRPFVMQWLEMEQPITIAQSHIQKQDFRFARYLKASMRDQTVAYVGRLVADNRPAAELVASDWTMMNDILARHYGYPEIDGGELRKITLRPDDPRGGGLLGHAGVQSMLCWMGDNWVIYRGAWALRHVLDRPPPPPPLEVPELSPADGKNKGKPFRELLKQHQADARCSVCHKAIDPVGFAFQNFDLSGRWRDVEYERYDRGELDGRIAWAGAGKTRPVDAAGHLPRGEAFTTFAGFKRILVKDYQADIVRGFLKNVFVYATGRKPGIDDLAEIAAIMADLKPKNYPLRDLLTAVVRSRAFRGLPPPAGATP